MNTLAMQAFRREFRKVAGIGAPEALSMGGLAGLTAIEGKGAFDKKKSAKERVTSGAEAGFTGSILASELLHNKDKLKGLVSKMPKVAAPMNQAAIMKSVASTGLRPGMAARAGVMPAARIAPVARAVPQAHSSYADFMPAGKFTSAGQGLPQHTPAAASMNAMRPGSVEQMRAKSQAMAQQIAPGYRAAIKARSM